MKTITLFNNKGGVGKTTVVYHLAYMMRDLGKRVVAVDLDPQSNLTTAFLEDARLLAIWPDAGVVSDDEPPKTILGAVNPLLRRLGDIGDPWTEEIEDGLWLLPGDLGLTRFEDRQAQAWPSCLDDSVDDAHDGFRVMTAYFRLMLRAAERHGADVCLVDVGPNLGAINRAALVTSDFVVVPIAADLFSLQGLRNLGPQLREWRQGWQTRRSQHVPKDISLPAGSMEPIGYVILQHPIRQDRPVKVYEPWLERIPAEYRTHILANPPGARTQRPDPLCLAELKHYRSLMPLAQEARKPMFFLKPADGAIGAHVKAVQDCYRDFESLAKRILDSASASPTSAQG